MADILRLLQEQGLGPESGLWDTPRPQPQAMLPMGGASVDMARALMAALQQMPQPTRRQGAGASFLRGAASGFGAATLGREGAKQAENEARAQANEKAEAAWQTGAREMSRRRWELQRERMKPQAAPTVGEMSQPISDEKRAALKLPSWVKNERDVNTFQEERRRQEDERKRADADAAQEASDDEYVRAVVEFRESPKVPMSGRTFEQAKRLRAKIDAALRPTGYSRTELEQLWDEADRFGKSGNSQRFTSLRLSATTLAKHIKSFEKFYQNWDKDYKDARKKVNPLDLKTLTLYNQGLFNAAQAGLLGSEAAAQAAELAPFIVVVQNELPLVLANGYAPVDRQYEESNRLLGGLLGPKANAARVRSLKEVIKGRLEAMSELREFRSGRTGKPNPFTLKLNPIKGWEEGEAEADGRPSLDSFVR